MPLIWFFDHQFFKVFPFFCFAQSFLWSFAVNFEVAKIFVVRNYCIQTFIMINNNNNNKNKQTNKTKKRGGGRGEGRDVTSLHIVWPTMSFRHL